MTDLHDNRLPVIAADIRTEHTASIAAAQASIGHAIKCGELLIEAKALLNKHGAWLPWLREHCDLSERTAQRYMRIARNKSATVADMGIAAADRMLATVGGLNLDLSRGAYDVDRTNSINIMIKPCGGRDREGRLVYVGWCHVIVLRMSDGDEGTMRRTLEGVHESELVAWLRHQGGVDADAVKWHPGYWEPTPDTYRATEGREVQYRARGQWA